MVPASAPLPVWRRRRGTYGLERWKDAEGEERFSVYRASIQPKCITTLNVRREEVGPGFSPFAYERRKNGGATRLSATVSPLAVRRTRLAPA